MGSVPKWPDFSMEEVAVDEGRVYYACSTDTGRPKTPIFNWHVSALPGVIEAMGGPRALAQDYVDRAFKRAHPNGCPSRAPKIEPYEGIFFKDR